MKAGWNTVKLGEACKIVNGATPSTSVEANWGGPHCWITPAEMGGLSDPYVGETRRTLTDLGLADCSASLLPAGSVILSSRAPIGHVIINTVPMATNQGCKSMIPRSDLDAKFLFYFIKANVPLLESLGTGATFKELSGGKLASVEIPLPPLAEQKRIVALLDEAFAGIDEAISKLESQSASVKQLLESYLGGVFSTEQHGWKTCQLKDCTIITMGQSPEGSTYNTKAIGTPLINGPVEFSADAFGETVKEKWTTEPTKLCKKGDLILCVRGSTTGRMNIAGFDACIGRGVAAIRAKQSQSWVNHFVNASRSKILGMGKGATFPNISADDIGQMELTMPPEEIQELLSKKFDDLRLLNAEMCRSIEKRASLLKMLKSSFLAKAFAGDLTP